MKKTAAEKNSFQKAGAALLHRPFLYNYELSREKIQKDKQMLWNNRQNA